MEEFSRVVSLQSTYERIQSQICEQLALIKDKIGTVTRSLTGHCKLNKHMRALK